MCGIVSRSGGVSEQVSRSGSVSEQVPGNGSVSEQVSLFDAEFDSPPSHDEG